MSNKLAHSGIKGMRWGVRKVRKKYTKYVVPAILSSAASVGIGIAANAALNQYKTNEVFRLICNNIFGNNAKFVIGGAGYNVTAILGALGTSIQKP